MENLMEREEEPAEDITDASLVHTSKKYNELLQLVQTTLQEYMNTLKHTYLPVNLNFISLPAVYCSGDVCWRMRFCVYEKSEC